jgi:hypothetical protein
VSALFKTPKVKVPKVEAPPPVPTIDEAKRDQNESNRLRRRRGTQSNMYTGPMGAAIPSAATPAKTLTGQ